ncbi:hypothetical protein [Roseomonas genomospecies 6]|nr:hypothetical protein [Roseomonas genomospecies 6]
MSNAYFIHDAKADRDWIWLPDARGGHIAVTRDVVRSFLSEAKGYDDWTPDPGRAPVATPTDLGIIVAIRTAKGSLEIFEDALWDARMDRYGFGETYVQDSYGGLFLREPHFAFARSGPSVIIDVEGVSGKLHVMATPNGPVAWFIDPCHGRQKVLMAMRVAVSDDGEFDTSQDEALARGAIGAAAKRVLTLFGKPATTVRARVMETERKRAQRARTQEAGLARVEVRVPPPRVGDIKKTAADMCEGRA